MIIEDDLIIVDSNGSEYTYEEFMSQGISKVNKKDISLKDELKNSINRVLLNRGFDEQDCFDMSYELSSLINNYLELKNVTNCNEVT